MFTKQLVFFSAIAAGVCSLALFDSARATELPIAPASYPEFNWNTVPMVADVCSQTGFSASEAQFLATHFGIVELEGGQGINGQVPYFDEEAADFAAAAQLKQYNPNVKVIAYWQAQVYLPNLYQADKAVQSSWLIEPPNGVGNVTFNQQNPSFQNWWVNTAVNIVANKNIDGLFIDGASAYPTVNTATYSMMQSLQQGLAGLDKPSLVLYNGLVLQGISPLTTLYYMKYANGGMIEHFDFHPSVDPNGDSPQIMSQQMQYIMALGEEGKIVIVHGWPDFYWIDPGIGSVPYQTLAANARSQITFPLAAFLVCAQKYTYFSYSWGYLDTQGSILLQQVGTKTVDTNWYSDLENSLGNPLGEPIINGYQWTRQFEHASVWVNLQTHQANITWQTVPAPTGLATIAGGALLALLNIRPRRKVGRPVTKAKKGVDAA